MAAAPPSSSSTRKNRQIETRLRQEYLSSRFRPDQVFYNQRLGSVATLPAGTPASVPARALANRLAYADAMVVTADSVGLWEAKISAYSGWAIGELLVYARKFRETPELAQYSALPLTLHILATEIDPDVAAVAQSLEIDVVIYRPGWALAEIASAFPGRSRPIDHSSATVRS